MSDTPALPGRLGRLRRPHRRPRNLIALFRVPTTLVFSAVQPVIFVLMFRYMFGGSIRIEGFR